MKKTFTRALSLLLVLVALIGVMPTAFALEADEMEAASFAINSNAVTLKVGETHQITATGMTTENGDELTAEELTLSYFTDAPAAMMTVSATGLVTALAVGEYDIHVIGKGTREGWSFTHVGEADIKVKVVAAESEGGETEEHAYTVTGDPAELTLAVDEVSEPLKFIVKDGDMVLSSDKYTVEGFTATEVDEGDDKDCISVDGEGVVKGLAAGTAKVEVTVTIKETGAEVNGFVAVTVEEAAGLEIEFAPKDSKANGSVTLKPVLKVNGKEVADATFKFVKKTDLSNIVVTTAANKKSAVVTSTQERVVEVEIFVEKYKLNAEDTEYITPDAEMEPFVTYVRFYQEVDVTVTVAGGKTKFGLTEEKVFSKVMLGTKEETSVSESSFRDLLIRYMPDGDTTQWPTGDKKRPATITYSSDINDAGRFETTGIPSGNGTQTWSNMALMKFAQIENRFGSTVMTVTVKDGNGLIMLTGTFTIVLPGDEGDIHYETSYNKPITLKKADFQTFWSNLKLGSQHTLEYVTFDTVGMSGTLWTDSTAKTAATPTTKFYLKPAAGQYDLSKVYYKPDSKKTGEYMDSFNFTAYGNYYGQTLESYPGTVTVSLNKTSANITALGTFFGTTYSKSIAESYKSLTGKDLGYVVFELPEAKYGKLYSKVPSESKVVHGQNVSLSHVAEATLLKKDDQLWYSASANQLALSTAAFIPAAGFKGEVELKYTAFDRYGENQYQGTLRFNVTAKTASSVFGDVTAKSYSWAADSVDFLFYEGTAQGSKAAGSNVIKYNPSANITRQDFMLMLYRAFLANDYSTFSVTTNFPDVVKGTSSYTQEIYHAVGVAKYLGIAQGTNDKFNPKSNITRQEAMVLIYRTLDVINKDLDYTVAANVAAFKDSNKISSWALTAITYLVNHGVIQGTNDKINPTANITRAEMGCILHRVLTY